MDTNKMSAESLNQLAEITSLKQRNYELQREIEDQRNYITFLKDKIEHLSEKPKKEVRYCVERSYSPGHGDGTRQVSKLFDNGWEFVSRSEFVPNHGGYLGYFEYILKKEVEVEDDND